MSRLIDADELMERFNAKKTLWLNVDEVLDVISDAPELPKEQDVVRCKDCTYWDETWTDGWASNYHYCPKIDGVRNGDFYCAFAERKTDERSN